MQRAIDGGQIFKGRKVTVCLNAALPSLVETELVGVGEMTAVISVYNKKDSCYFMYRKTSINIDKICWGYVYKGT